jgi:hypothetical protein
LAAGADNRDCCAVNVQILFTRDPHKEVDDIAKIARWAAEQGEAQAPVSSKDFAALINRLHIGQ